MVSPDRPLVARQFGERLVFVLARQFPWANLGRIYAARGDRQRAIECFRKSLEILPGYPVAVQMLERLVAGTNGFAHLG